MTYTARATLEIGSGAVCSGRAVTTTTASNQVRTPRARPAPPRLAPPGPTCGPPERLFSTRKHHAPQRTNRGLGHAQTKHRTPSAIDEELDQTVQEHKNSDKIDPNQMKLMSALCPKGSNTSDEGRSISNVEGEGKEVKPRGPSGRASGARAGTPRRAAAGQPASSARQYHDDSNEWMSGVDKWYDGLAAYQDQLYQMQKPLRQPDADSHNVNYKTRPTNNNDNNRSKSEHTPKTGPNIAVDNIVTGNRICGPPKKPTTNQNKQFSPAHAADDINYIPKKTTLAKPDTIESLVSEKETYKLHRVDENLSDNDESDISLRKEYRKRVGLIHVAVHSPASVNPRNIRSMTISKTPIIDLSEAHQSSDVKETAHAAAVSVDTNISVTENASVSKDVDMLENTERCTHSEIDLSSADPASNPTEMLKTTTNISYRNEPDYYSLSNNYTDFQTELLDHSSVKSDPQNDDIELEDFVSNNEREDDTESFLQYCTEQQKLFHSLEATNEDNNPTKLWMEELNNNNYEKYQKCELQDIELKEMKSNKHKTCLEKDLNEKLPVSAENNNETLKDTKNNEVVKLNEKPQAQGSGEQYIIAELPNNAYVFLTLPKRLLLPLHNKDQKPPLQLLDTQNNANANVNPPENRAVGKVSSKKKKDKVLGPNNDAKKKDAINKNALKVLLFEHLERDESVKPGTSVAGNEVGTSQYLNKFL